MFKVDKHDVFRKAVVKSNQINAIDNAVKTVKFIRNQALQLGIDATQADKIDRYAVNKYCCTLAKEYNLRN